MRRLLLAFVLAASLDCSSKSEPARQPLAIADGCNPLDADWDCLLPFPSDVFLVDDPSMPSGKRVRLGSAAVKTKEGTPVDFMVNHPADGATHLPQILAFFPSAIDAKNLVFHDRAQDSTQVATSPTLLLEADTGAPVLHFAELDARSQDDGRRALIVRPLIKLSNKKRYVVAIRRLVDTSGKPVPTPEGFRRLRDREYDGDPKLGPLGTRYEKDVFAVLDKAGVPRAELQLAWDFTVRSEENASRDLLEVRKIVMDTFTKTPPKVAITSVEENPDARTRRLIQGTIEVPLFLDDPKPLSKLRRDASGHVTTNGTVSVPFSVFVPPGVTEKARLFTYGHGFFGEREELYAGWSAVPDIAGKAGMVGMAVDWWGMAADDEKRLGDLFYENRMQDLFLFTDRVHQGMANQLALAYAALGPLKDLDALKIDGKLVYDPSTVYWFGISQGHILGSTYVALSPHVDRAVLEVGGAGFSMMMSRSESFTPFLAFIELLVPDPVDVQKIIALSQVTMDRVEPITYAPHLIKDGYEGGPKTRTVLMQMALYDSLVPNISSDVHARTVGVSHYTPSPRANVPGLPNVTGPFAGSAQIDFDFQLPPEKRHGIVANIPPENNKVHDNLRKLDVVWRQIDAFLKPGGTVQSFCDGACDPQ